MARRLKTPAIVLRRWPYSETSLTLRALTPDQGTIGLLAKGANQLKSGHFGVLDTWAMVEIECSAPDRAELQTLWSARLLDRLGGLDADPERLAAAAVVAEIAEEAAPPGLPAPGIFLWLAGTLQRLAAQPAGSDPTPELVRALAAGLRLLGLAPALESPAGDGGEWFSPAAGGLVRAAVRPHEHARRPSAAALALLRRLARGEPEAESAAPGSEPWDECLTILGDFLQYHLERTPRAWSLLQERRRRRRSRARSHA